MNIIKMITDSVFPRRCAYCDKLIAGNRRMCSSCEKTLSRINGLICPKCGRGKDECSCKGAEMYYDALVAPFYFEGNVRKGVHIFKFRRGAANAEAYGFEMAETVKERLSNVNFDFVTAVPISKKRLRERGYDQCDLLAKRVSENLDVEYKPDVFIKLYETGIQHGLPYYLRKGNLTGVIDVSDPGFVKDKTVLICDDISTTGETLNECSKMLWLYDAKEIYCVAVALTKKKKQKDKK